MLRLPYKEYFKSYRASFPVITVPDDWMKSIKKNREVERSIREDKNAASRNALEVCALPVTIGNDIKA